MASITKGDGAIAGGVHTAGASSAGVINFAYTQEDIAGEAEIYWKVRLRTTESRPAVLVEGRNANKRVIWSIVRNKSRLLELRDGHNAVVDTGAVEVPANSTVRLEGRAKIHASTLGSNVLEVKLFVNPNATTADETITENGEYMGVQGGETRYIDYGRINPSAHAFSVTSSDFDSATGGYIGPGSSGSGTWTTGDWDPAGAGGINAAEQDPNDLDIWYMNMDVGGHRVSYDGGFTWQVATRLYLSDGMRKTMGLKAVDNPASPGNTIIGIACGANPSVYCESIDQAQSFQIKNTADANWQAQSPSGADQSDGVPNLPRHGGDFCFSPNNGFRYFGTYKQGIWRSPDGFTWTRIAMVPGNEGVSAWYIRKIYVDPTSPVGTDRLLVLVYDGPGGTGGIYRVPSAQTGTGKTLANGGVVRIGPTTMTRPEELAFASGYVFCADANDIWRCNTTGMGTAGNWNNMNVPNNGTWCTVDAYDNAGVPVIGVGCHDPAKVDANGVTTTANSGLYANLMRCQNANASTPTWTLFSNQNNNDLHDVSSGELFWRSVDRPAVMLGKDQADIIVFRWVNGTTHADKEAKCFGAGGVTWHSFNASAVASAVSWQVAFEGVVICSTQSVWGDENRNTWAWGGNQDHDFFFTKNRGVDWRRTPEISGFTTGFIGCADPWGYVYACEGAAPASSSSTGQLLRWNGTGADPVWTSIGTANGLPNLRSIAVVTGMAANSQVKEIVLQDDSRIWGRANRSGTWAVKQDLGGDVGAGWRYLIWPNKQEPTSGVLFLELSGSIYRSNDYGESWDEIISGSVSSVFAAKDQHTVIYYTTNDNSLRRLRSANTHTLGASGHIDTISMPGARTGAFSPDGDMAVWCAPAAGRDCAVFVVRSPESTGTTFSDKHDILSTTDLATNNHGQMGLGRCINLAFLNDSTIVYGVSGASYARSVLV